MNATATAKASSCSLSDCLHLAAARALRHALIEGRLPVSDQAPQGESL